MTTTVPKLDLAPKLNRPLSLWNPLDYLRLLYWCFFFPQALRWYVERFGKADYPESERNERGFWKLLRADPMQRNLLFQGLVVAVLTPIALAALALAQSMGKPIDRSVVWAVVAVGIAGCMPVVVAFVVAFIFADSAEGSIGSGVVFNIAFGLAFTLAFNIALGPAFDMTGVGGVAFFVATNVGFVWRLPDYVLTCLLQRRDHIYPLSRVTLLPLPGLHRQLLSWLQHNPTVGIANAKELLAYSMQHIPVVQAVNDWLAEISPAELLHAVDALVAEPFNWDIVYYGSAPLIGPRTPLELKLRLDTPAHAACAGYWYLHRRLYWRDKKAIPAFEQVRHLPNGETLYQSVVAIYSAKDAEDLQAIAAWEQTTHWLTALTEAPLRPRVIATLQRLRAVALEAHVAAESASKLNRTTALGRAVGALTALMDDVEQTCPYPEWPLIKETAQRWREILAKAGGEAGQQAITQPVPNPFVVGNPVTGGVFVGREEIFARLEELWGSDAAQVVPSVVLFGHRRMGKSSILQNLSHHRFGVNTVLAAFTMQRAGRLAHTGELLGAFALTIHDAVVASGLTLPEPNLTDYASNGYATFNQFLRAVKRGLNGRRVILTIDEFELIERAIAEGHLDAEVLAFLRGVIHSEPWFVLALAGLHTLEEMTADYWNPLFASVTPVRVSFLSPGASAQLLANPTDDFPLDVTRAVADRVYALVRGQPYLTQLIGHTLVRLYNQSVFEEAQPRAPRFTSEDVDEVVSQVEFYEQGSYYFTGVWQQAESTPPGQVALLRALAAADEPQPASELITRAALDEAVGPAALTALVRHDVLTHSSAKYDFSVPLMRRWLREHKP